MGVAAAGLRLGDRQLQGRHPAHQPAQHLPLVPVPDHVLECPQLRCRCRRLPHQQCPTSSCVPQQCRAVPHAKGYAYTCAASKAHRKLAIWSLRHKCQDLLWEFTATGSKTHPPGGPGAGPCRASRPRTRRRAPPRRSPPPALRSAASAAHLHAPAAPPPLSARRCAHCPARPPAVQVKELDRCEWLLQMSLQICSSVPHDTDCAQDRRCFQRWLPMEYVQ